MYTKTSRLWIAALAGIAVGAAPASAQKDAQKKPVAACACKSGKAAKKAGKRDACAVPMTLTLSGLHCQGCEMVVTQSLLAVPGVEEAQVSAKAQRAVVWVCPHRKVGSAALQSAVVKAGYRVVRVEKGDVPASPAAAAAGDGTVRE